jgi:LytS/YehU family sensor histidine kinase
MEMLDLYMTLEKVRFKGEISYTLHVDSTLDPEDVVIPSMMIQPHLENAIVHGLRTKTDEKVITVCLQELSPDYVSVVIEDNGIGLHAATQLKVSQLGSKHRHKSKGLEICTQRIAVLRETYPKTEFKITDRSVTTPGQSGTRIALILPILTKSV